MGMWIDEEAVRKGAKGMRATCTPDIIDERGRGKVVGSGRTRTTTHRRSSSSSSRVVSGEKRAIDGWLPLPLTQSSFASSSSLFSP
uniref:Uncharacterized protein n=1 Tax=Onchocerca volvulus TaxID=6282 RepID=A0A8R1XR21_ONCVO